jgi:cytochrome P450
MEACGDMAYLGYVMYEGLRTNPPAPGSSPLYFKEDITLGKYRIKGGDYLIINFYGLQHSSA